VSRAVFAAASALWLLGSASTASATDFVRGVDLSGLEEIERHGGRYLSQGEPSDAVGLLAEHGTNFVRLRLAHTPTGGVADLASVARVARRAREQGLGFLLAVHYSDRRADASRQSGPEAWSGFQFEDLRIAVFRYTHDVIAELRKEDALPDMVQIGNEITNGMLWNLGRVSGRYDTDEQWTRLAQLIQSATLGLEAALHEGDTVETVIHIDPGALPGTSRRFIDRLVALGVDFDVIGLSFFPWWHGTLDRLERELTELAEHHEHDILLVETAYPWTLRWVDETQNEVGGMSALPAAYDPTPAGQRRYLEDVAAVVAATPGGRGRGFFYFAPERITAPGLGSHWENVALFGADGEVLPAARVLGPPIEEGD
jgi:arabinogalactan endo-1,4-beta-galactosidase